MDGEFGAYGPDICNPWTKNQLGCKVSVKVNIYLAPSVLRLEQLI